MHEQVRQIVVTGFGQMDLVAGPDRTPLDAHVRLGIIGRRN